MRSSRTSWRKRRHGIGSRSEKPVPAGSFRRAQSWRRCCRRFRLLSCLSWRCIFHESWENNSIFQMGGLWETGGLLLFSPVRAHLLTTQKGSGTCPWQAVRSARRMRLLRQPPDNATAPTDAAVIVCAGLSCFRFGNSLRPARTNLPPAALFAAMTRCSTSGHFLFYERETEKERTR